MSYLGDLFHITCKGIWRSYHINYIRNFRLMFNRIAGHLPSPVYRAYISIEHAHSEGARVQALFESIHSLCGNGTSLNTIKYYNMKSFESGMIWVTSCTKLLRIYLYLYIYAISNHPLPIFWRCSSTIPY